MNELDSMPEKSSTLVISHEALTFEGKAGRPGEACRVWYVLRAKYLHFFVGSVSLHLDLPNIFKAHMF